MLKRSASACVFGGFDYIRFSVRTCWIERIKTPLPDIAGHIRQAKSIAAARTEVVHR